MTGQSLDPFSGKSQSKSFKTSRSLSSMYSHIDPPPPGATFIRNNAPATDVTRAPS